MKKVRIQKQVAPDPAIKKWETILSCGVDCLASTLWVLQRRNPDTEYRIHILDNPDES